MLPKTHHSRLVRPLHLGLGDNISPFKSIMTSWPFQLAVELANHPNASSTGRLVVNLSFCLRDYRFSSHSDPLALVVKSDRFPFSVYSQSRKEALDDMHERVCSARCLSGSSLVGDFHQSPLLKVGSYRSLPNPSNFIPCCITFGNMQDPWGHLHWSVPHGLRFR